MSFSFSCLNISIREFYVKLNFPRSLSLLIGMLITSNNLKFVDLFKVMSHEVLMNGAKF